MPIPLFIYYIFFSCFDFMLAQICINLGAQFFWLASVMTHGRTQQSYKHRFTEQLQFGTFLMWTTKD